MKIPEKVKIGGREYKIEQSEHRAAGNGDDICGEVWWSRNSIYLYENLPEDGKAATLLHEIIHAIFHHCGRFKQRDDEGLVNALAEGIFQVINDNPEMFRNE